MTETIDLIHPNTRLLDRSGQPVIPDGETYIHVDGVRKLKLDKTAKCSYGHGIPDTPQFKGLNGETDVTTSYEPHTYYLELPPGYQVMSGGTTVQYPSMGICTGGSPTTIQMGAHSQIGFVFGVDRVSGAQTELCGADVWSEDGVSIPITCASSIIMPEKPSVCPVPTVSISNFKIADTTASCDITFDAGVGTNGDVDNSQLQRYNGASWDTNVEILYHAFQEGSSGTFHVEWEMIQTGDCVIVVNIVNMCGERSGSDRKDLQFINPGDPAIPPDLIDVPDIPPTPAGCLAVGDRVQPITVLIGKVGFSKATVAKGGCGDQTVDIRPDGWTTLNSISASSLRLLDDPPTPSTIPSLTITIAIGIILLMMLFG